MLITNIETRFIDKEENELGFYMKKEDKDAIDEDSETNLELFTSKCED